MESTTIEQEKERLRQNFNKGCNCGACGQFVKLYPRSMGSMCILGLIKLTKKFGVNKEFFIDKEIDFFKLNSTVRGDFSKLRFWGLIGQRKALREDGSSRNGWWFITNKGKEFVDLKIKIERNALVFDNRFYGYRGKLVSIVDVLGKNFSYRELMNG